MRTHHYCKHCWSWELCNLPGCFMSAWPLKTLVVNKEIQFLGTPRAVTTRILCTVKCRDFSFWTIVTILYFTLEYLGSYLFWNSLQRTNDELNYSGFYVFVLTSFVPYHETSMATIWRNVRVVSLCSFSLCKTSWNMPSSTF